MEVETRIYPWSSEEEWQFVKSCLLEKKLLSAQNYIELWRSKCQKLDAGKFSLDLLNIAKS